LTAPVLRATVCRNPVDDCSDHERRGLGHTELATNDIMLRTFDFDTTTSEGIAMTQRSGY
jgi:hypothetical protein